MQTYYKVLGIASDATTAEIEVACETQYNHWRRLVTHHDPDTANKANQALQWLERARTTLADPVKREVYDTSIGLRGPIGGLADPQARPKVVAPKPPPPRPHAEPQTQSASAAGERVDAWICHLAQRLRYRSVLCCHSSVLRQRQSRA